ncbi:MAG: PBECR4 domain-containing protein [Oenococcus sp.]|uniref:PBECR4 domain-containing protein n=1 Tax=Oenococcus sp. TaxID=1979414 RepID=UPI0039E8501B
MKRKYFLKFIRNSNTLHALRSGQHFFEETFLNQTVTYFYKDRFGQDRAVAIKFQENQFMHLAGLSYARGAKSFWNDLKKCHLTFSDLTPVHGNINVLKNKIKMMSFLSETVSQNCRVVYQYHTYHLLADYLIKSDKETVAIATRAFDGSDQIMESLLDVSAAERNGFPIKQGFAVTRIIFLNNKTGRIKIVE